LDNIDKHRTILVVDPRLMIKKRQADGTVSVVKRRLSGVEDLPSALAAMRVARAVGRRFLFS